MMPKSQPSSTVQACHRLCEPSWSHSHTHHDALCIMATVSGGGGRSHLAMCLIAMVRGVLSSLICKFEVGIAAKSGCLACLSTWVSAFIFEYLSLLSSSSTDSVLSFPQLSFRCVQQYKNSTIVKQVNWQFWLIIAINRNRAVLPFLLPIQIGLSECKLIFRQQISEARSTEIIIFVCLCFDPVFDLAR